MGWVFSWLITGIKERLVGRGEWFDYLGIAALLLTPATGFVQVLQSMQTDRRRYSIGPVPLVTALWFAGVLLYAVWIEIALWRTIRKLGRTARRGWCCSASISPWPSAWRSGSGSSSRDT